MTNKDTIIDIYKQKFELCSSNNCKYEYENKCFVKKSKLAAEG